MAKPASRPRRFRVHARDVAPYPTRTVEEQSFEAAALAYVEDLGEVAGERREIRVIVHDLDDGREHCFLVEIDTGETAPCA